ncbi:MAG: zinc ribbon domain-containing protein [Paenibacillus dendritiformis]|uniref:zinc ribbon domain-containing protein n=1 Tax=uncultured Paenibacillus sp. TaxID=227322 RepID=UPI0025F4ECAA|nr:zinc ribbon domain-containing protein [uncultured Paenibacillus sp.]MDU5140919.1 zinc ribbon domain-containing protein [Paenibacillus dendritiformis]
MNRILQKLREGASKASEKAQNVIEINRLQSQIAARRKEIEQNVYLIGERVYDAYKKKDLTLAEDEVMALGDANLLLEEEIKQLEWKVSELRHEKRCECGEVAPITSNYCASCGRKLPEAPEELFEEDEDWGKEEEETRVYTHQPSSVSESAPMAEDGGRWEPPQPEDDEDREAEARYTYHPDRLSSHDGLIRQKEEFSIPPLESSRSGREMNITVGGRPVARKREEPSVRRCPNCNSAAEPEAKWCERCGTPFI